MNSPSDSDRVVSALNSALGFIGENYKRVLYPLNSFQASPDYYVLTVDVLRSSALISRDEVTSILGFVLENQRKNGSWPEILASGRSEENSVVVTSSLGSRLLDFATVLDDSFKTNILKRLQRAADFVVSREIENGWFRKSENVFLDTVNVNALASLFLTKCYAIFRLDKYLNSASRGLARVMESQEKDGEFLYYANEPEISSVFYHAITTNCLVELQKEQQNQKTLKSALTAALWIQERQMPYGGLSWRNSIDHWVYRDFATYAPALNVFESLSHYENALDAPLQRALRYVLMSQEEDGSFPIKDAQRTMTTLREDFSNATCLASSMPTQFPQSILRTTRLLLYDIRIPQASVSYRLLNGGKSYSKSKFLTTVEMTESLMKCFDSGA